MAKEKTKKNNKFSMANYIKKHTPMIILWFVMAIGSYVLRFIVSIYSARSLEALSAGDMQLMFHYLVIVTIISVCISILNIPINHTYVFVSSRVFRDIKKDLTARLFQISAESYGEIGAGAFVQRVLNDPEATFNVFTSMFDIVCSIITNIAVIIYIMTFNIYIGLLFFGIIVILFLIDYFRNKYRRRKRKEFMKLDDDIRSYTNEIVRSQLDIKTLDMEDSLKSVTFEKHRYAEGEKARFYYRNRIILVSRNVFVDCSMLAIATLAIYIFKNFALPMVAFLYIYQNRNIFNNFSNLLNAIQERKIDFQVSYERIKELFDEEVYPIEKFGDVSIENVKGQIEFKNVSFGYNIFEKEDKKEGKKKKAHAKRVIKGKKQVLTDLCFKIEAGENVAIVGRSGAGKSTIVNLIPKIYECDSGQVLLDGKDVKTLTKECLRKNVSVVNQSPYIFNLSIRENLTFAKPNASEEELFDALKGASLFDFVESLDNGIDTIVGENGIKLSGGQKQRLAIARALLKNSKIIIFDESTSSLDNFAQDEVKNAIQNLGGERTVITVAHRLSTIKNAQKIYFIENGQILASGNFESLISSCKEFADLFSIEQC